MSLQLFLTSLAVVLAIGYSCDVVSTNCGTPCGGIYAISDAQVTPKIVLLPGSLTISGSLSLPGPVTLQGSKLTVWVKRGFLPAIPLSFDFCDIMDGHCPDIEQPATSTFCKQQADGTFLCSISTTADITDIPSIIADFLGGTYNLQAEIKLNDQLLTCLKVDGVTLAKA